MGVASVNFVRPSDPTSVDRALEIARGQGPTYSEVGSPCQAAVPKAIDTIDTSGCLGQSRVSTRHQGPPRVAGRSAGRRQGVPGLERRSGPV